MLYQQLCIKEFYARGKNPSKFGIKTITIISMRGKKEILQDIGDIQRNNTAMMSIRFWIIVGKV